jgi:hypothetical protein
MSYLLLEEASDSHDAKTDAVQAYTARQGGAPTGTSAAGGSAGGSGGSGGPGGSSAGGTSRSAAGSSGSSAPRFKNKKKGCGGGYFGAPSSGGGSSCGQPFASNNTFAPWVAGYNPWTGLVQAWSMPIRAPSSGVLGPRPPFNPQQAMTALHQPLLSSSPATVWDQKALYTALNSAGITNQPPNATEWFLDTGASNHMSSNTGNLHSSRPFNSSIIVGNGDRLPVTHAADTSIPTSSHSLALNNILVSPSLVKNLVSVRQLTRDNHVSIEFDPYSFSVKDLHTGTETLRCNSSGELYPLRLPQPQTFTASTAPSVDLWHQRLGHPGSPSLSQVLQSFGFSCNKSEAHSCHSCRLGKHVRLPFSSSATKSFFPFQLGHSDVWTSPVLSNSGFKYYVVFLDDFTHYICTFPIRAKSDVFLIIRAFHAYVQTQFRLPLVAQQTDNGREYDSHALRTFFSTHGISLCLSCPYTSQQNGKAERVLRTINDCLRTLLIHSRAPLAFWIEALNTATFLLN